MKIIEKIKETLESYKRVLKVSRKPTKREFIKTLEISLIFIFFIGLMSFIIYFISILLR